MLLALNTSCSEDGYDARANLCTYSATGSSKLTTLLQAIPPGRRGGVLQSAVSFRLASTLEQSIAFGPIRGAFADSREARFGQPVPAEPFRAVLGPPVPIETVHRSTPGRWTTRTARVGSRGTFKKGQRVDGSFTCQRLELESGRGDSPSYIGMEL